MLALQNYRKVAWVMGYAICVLQAMSCKKLVHVDPPQDQDIESKIFSTDSLSEMALNGIYVRMMGTVKHPFNGALSIFPALSADDLVPILNTYDQQFFDNTVLTSNRVIMDSIWGPLYAYIYQCNICIHGLNKYSGVSAEVRKKILREVSFVRAMCYYYLVILYGAVPLATTPNATTNATLPRSQEPEIYKQIIADLQYANSGLPEMDTNVLPSRMASTAWLARVYLHEKDWAKAEAHASILINSGKFHIEKDLNKVFLADSRETIYQLMPVMGNYNTVEGAIFVPYSNSFTPQYQLTGSLLSSFEPGDQRKENWIACAVTYGNTTYYYPHKYKVKASTSPTEYNIALRLAEQYLIRAEARVKQNNLDGAIEDINIIRGRAGLALLSPGISQSECIKAIENERRKEFFAEWGHRWIDLKRTSRADALLSAEKGNKWQSTDQLYPIPLHEIMANENLVQNPGY